MSHDRDENLKKFLRDNRPVPPAARLGEAEAIFRKIENGQESWSLFSQFTRKMSALSLAFSAAVAMSFVGFMVVRPEPGEQMPRATIELVEPLLAFEASIERETEADAPSLMIGQEYLDLATVWAAK